MDSNLFLINLEEPLEMFKILDENNTIEKINHLLKEQSLKEKIENSTKKEENNTEKNNNEDKKEKNNIKKDNKKIDKFFNKFLVFVNNSNEEILLTNKEAVYKLIFILKRYFHTFENISIEEIIENKSNDIEEFLNSFIFLLKNKTSLFKEEYLSEELINLNENLLKEIAKKLIVLLKQAIKKEINFVEHIKIIKTYPNIFYHAVKENKKTIEIQVPLYKMNLDNCKITKKETEEYFAFSIHCKKEIDPTGYILDNIPQKMIFDILVNKNIFQNKIKLSSEKGILKIYLYKRSFFYE